jgi:hypothetical protein
VPLAQWKDAITAKYITDPSVSIASTAELERLRLQPGEDLDACIAHFNVILNKIPALRTDDGYHRAQKRFLG